MTIPVDSNTLTVNDEVMEILPPDSTEGTPVVIINEGKSVTVRVKRVESAADEFPRDLEG